MRGVVDFASSRSGSGSSRVAYGSVLGKTSPIVVVVSSRSAWFWTESSSWDCCGARGEIALNVVARERGV